MSFSRPRPEEDLGSTAKVGGDLEAAAWDPCVRLGSSRRRRRPVAREHRAAATVHADGAPIGGEQLHVPIGRGKGAAGRLGVAARRSSIGSTRSATGKAGKGRRRPSATDARGGGGGSRRGRVERIRGGREERGKKEVVRGEIEKSPVLWALDQNLVASTKW